MKKVCICLLVYTLTCSLIWADSRTDQRYTESVKKKIASCVDQQRRVVVETFDNKQLQGFVTEAGADDFVLSYGGRATTLSYGNVKRVRWPSPVWKQAKLIAGAAAIVGALFGLVVLLGGLKG
jgi:hypothetical protein